MLTPARIERQMQPGQGERVFDFGGLDYANAVTIDAENRIVAAGFMLHRDWEFAEFATLRLSPDGELDRFFGGGGAVTHLHAVSENRAKAVMVDYAGRIVEVGYSGGRFLDGGTRNSYDFIVSRITATGAPDVSFGNAGGVFTSPEEQCGGVAAILLDDIYAVGNESGANRWHASVRRYRMTDGSLDPSFGTRGAVHIDPDDPDSDAIVYAAAATRCENQPCIALAGVISGGEAHNHYFLARMLLSGALDMSFGSNGKFVSPLSKESNAFSLAVDPRTGNLVVGGWMAPVPDTGGMNLFLARHLPDGSLDETFGCDGIVQVSLHRGDEVVSALAVRPDGRIVGVGHSGSFGYPDPRGVVLQWLPDGRLDPGFGDQGVLVLKWTEESVQDWAGGVALQGDGKIVVVGTTEAPGDTDFVVLRLNEDGSLDTDFAGD